MTEVLPPAGRAGLLLRGGRLVGAGVDDRTPLVDLAVDGEVVRRAVDGLPPDPDVKSVDLRGGLVMRGLCNAHLHSNEMLDKGRHWGLPLEPYLPLVWPASAGAAPPVRPRDIYARTLMNCWDQLLSGTTHCVDDVVHADGDPEVIDAVLRAYRDSGMTADVSIVVTDVPHDNEVKGFGERVRRDDLGPVRERLDVLETFMREWNVPGSPVRVVASGSAPQRASAALLVELKDLASRYDATLLLHVQETLVQATTGPRELGRSMVRHLDDLGVLDSRTVLAHLVHPGPDDVGLIAGTGACVVHNPVSNLKLGSGIAPTRVLRQAGVPVALGTDGNTCNDAQSVLEVIKHACLLSTIADRDPARWIGPAQALEFAVVGGRRAMSHGPVGGPDVVDGSPADLVVLDPDSPSMLPLNDALAQVVFAADRRDVRMVVSRGRTVVKDGRVCDPRYTEVVGEIRAIAEERRRFGTAPSPERQQRSMRMWEAYRLACTEQGRHGRRSGTEEEGD